MSMEQLFPIVIALILIMIAWKVLKGTVKTVALVAILAVTAYFVFGVGL